MQTRIWYLAVGVLLVAHIVIGEYRWDFEIQYDGFEYLQMAQHMLDTSTYTYDGEHFVVGKPPGYSFALAAYMWITGTIDGFHHVQVLAYFAAFVIIGLIVRRLLGLPWGILSIAILVLVDPLRWLSFTLMSEPMFILLTAAGISATLVLAESRARRWVIVAGVMFGLSTYVRPINLFWPVVMLLIVTIGQRELRRSCTIILALHILIVAPWIVRNAVHFGRVIPMVSNWSMLYYMTNETLYSTLIHAGPADAMASDDYKAIAQGEYQFNWETSERFRRAAWARIKSDPLDYMWRCVRQFAFTWTFIPGSRTALWAAPKLFLVGRLLMILFHATWVIGALALIKKHRWLVTVLVGYAVYSAIVLFPVRTESRYLIVPYMMLVPLIMAGLSTFWHIMKRRVIKGPAVV